MTTDLLAKKETQQLKTNLTIGDFHFNRDVDSHSCEVCDNQTHYIWQGYNLAICSTECLEQKVGDVVLVQVFSDWVKSHDPVAVEKMFTGDVVQYSRK